MLHLPSAVIAPLRFGGTHDLAQVLPEIGGLANLVVNLVIVEHQLRILKGVLGCGCQETGLLHLRKHNVTPFTRQFLAAQGIVER